MPQISNLSFNVSFEPHNPNRVGLINTTPDLPAGFVGIFKVTQPDGYVRNGDINTPDVTNVVSSCVITIVPDSSGQLQQGQYTIEFIGNAPGYLSTSFIRTFTFQYTPATISLRNDFDVFTPQLAYTDISNYNVSGYTISTGPTRRWDATSTTTGTISGTNSSIDIRYNNQYYAETYSIEFRVNVAYVSQAYPWLSITHTRTQTTSVTACIPKSLEDLTQAVEALREESNASCGGDWARFEKANSLYVHLINMLRLVLIAGEHQDGFFDVYQQLLTYIQNGSVACDSIGQVIPPYDFSDYESSIYDGQSSYCQLVGDGVNTVYRVNHQLGDECVVVQVYEVATGKQVFCDLAVSTINSIDITFYEPPTLNQYRVVAVAGALGLRGQGFQPGGLTGQILRKKTDADFDTEWADVTVALPLLVPYNGATQSVYLGEHGIEAGFVRLDTTPTATPATPAVMSWNDTDGTAELRLKGNNVTLQVGQEMVARVVNKTGANLLGSQYKAVRVRKVSEGGAQGQRLAVVLAQANTEFMSTDMLGIVTENIDNNQEGFITTFGAVKNIDTTGALQGEVWVDGDILFLSPTVPGGLTKVKPSAPNHLSIVGYVEYAHQNNGKIFVHVQTSWELDELHNVSITNPVNNQVLKYNGTLWVNSTFPAVTSVGLATATSGVTITDTPVTSEGVININIATASASSNGLLSSADWATFNAKQSALTFGNISTATSGVTITNGNASTVGPNVSISIATAGSGQNGLLSAADWATFNAKQSAITLTTTGNSGAATFVGSTLNIPNYTLAGLGGVPTTRSLTINGTAYDLSADRTWSVGTVTSVAALTIGTAGTDITSTVATGTTTPVITLNVPTASAANRGALSAADWTTFNAKVSGSGTTNYVPKFTAAGTIGNSQIVDNAASGVNIGAKTLVRDDGPFVTGSNISGGTNNMAIGTATGGGFLSFYTNATDRLIVTSGGNVGIGTSSPGSILDVRSTGYNIIRSTGGNGGYFDAYNTSGTRLASFGAESGGDVYFGSRGSSPVIAIANNTERLRIFANGRVGINTTTDAGYQLDINGTLRSVNGANFATTSGSVGIGKTSPQTNSKLDVEGNIYVSDGSFIHLRNSIATPGSYGIHYSNTAPRYPIRIAGAADPITQRFVEFGHYTGDNKDNTWNPQFVINTYNGNTGIGTASPANAKLVVEGTSAGTVGAIMSTDVSGTTSFIRMLGDVASQNLINWQTGTSLRFATSTQAYGTFVERMRITDAGVITVANLAGSGARVVVADASGNLSATTLSSSVTTGSGTTNYVTKWTGASTQGDSQIFDNGTNVGVGTTSPVARLDVLTSSTNGIDLRNLATSVGDQTSKSSPRLRLVSSRYEGGNVDAPFSFQNVRTGSPTNDQRLAITNFGDVEVLSITNLGFVGIGTTSPNERMTIQGAASAGAAITLRGNNAASSNEMLIGQGNANESYVYNRANQPMIFGTNNTERLRITSGGDVGIGTSSPALKLHVVGDIGTTTRVATDLINGWTGGSTPLTIQTGGAQSLIFGTSATERLRIFANGRIGINTTTDAGYQLDVNGTFRTTGTVDLATSGGEVRIGMADAGNYVLQVGGPTYLVGSANTALTTSAGLHMIAKGDNTYFAGFNFQGVAASDMFFGRTASSDDLVISTSNTGSPAERVRFKQNGDVGIGTNAPSYKLDINGTLRSVNGANFATSSGNVVIGTATASSISTARLSILGSGVQDSYVQVMNGAGGGFLMGSLNGTGMQFYTLTGTQGSESGTKRMEINSNGEMLINTSTDAGDYKLQVAGNIYNTGSAVLAATSGNVGVGTASPAEKLDVTSTLSRIVVTSTTNSNNAALYFNAKNSGGTNVQGGVYFIPAATPYLSLSGDNSGTHLNVTSAGNVGIGTASPSIKLDIGTTADQTLGIKSSTSNYLFAGTYQNYAIFSVNRNPSNGVFTDVNKATADIAIGGLANEGLIIFNTTATNNSTATERMRLTASGELLINTTSDAGDYKLQVAGNIYNTGSAVLAATSGNVGIGTSSPAAKLDIAYSTNPTTATPHILLTTGGTAKQAAITAESFSVSGLVFSTGDGTLVDRMTILRSNGNVGIGTTSPPAKLLVNTTTNENVAIGSLSSIPTGRTMILQTSTAGGTIETYQSTTSSYINTLINPNGGNVGIGTTSPTERLDVRTTVVRDPSSGEAHAAFYTNAAQSIDRGAQITLGGGVNNAGTSVSNFATIAGLKENSTENNTAGTLSFWTRVSGGPMTRKMTITSAGNVGIGVTPSPWSGVSPSLQLGVSPFIASTGQYLFLASNTYYDGTNAIYTSTGSAATYAQSEGRHIFNTAPSGTAGAVATYTERMRIFNNGRVAINTTTDAGYQLDVNGGTRVTGRVTVTGNDTLGLSITRAGTSAIASEIYNGGGDNGWLLYGVESSAGGVIFPGTTAYASVFGSFRSVPVQFATNNAVRMTIDGGGSVGIGVASPSASAILQVDSTTKGMLPPRMTTTQRDAITSPATGLIVYDTTVNKISVYNGTTWKYAQYE